MKILLALVLVVPALQDRGDEAIDRFARALGDGELETRLRDVLLTPAGKAAVKKEIVTALSQKAVAGYFRERFDEQGRLRETSKEEAAQILQEFQAYQKDMAELKAAAEPTAARLADEPEINAQAKRLLQSEAGLQILYFAVLRPAVGGAERQIAAGVKRAFEEDAEGKLVLRPEAKEKLDAVLADVDKKLAAVEAIAKQLQELAPRISDEGINGRIKKAIGSPVAAAVIAAQDPEARVEDAFIEIEGKLSLLQPYEERVEKLLAVCEEGGRRLESLKATFDAIADRIRDDEAGARLKSLLRNDVVRVAILAKLPGGKAASVSEAFQKWVDASFEERDGLLRLKDALADKAACNLKKAAKAGEILKQAMDLISREAQKISDEEPVKAVYASPFAAAKFVERLLTGKEEVRRAGARGIAQLVSEHFVKEGDRYSVREESRAMIEDFIRRVEAPAAGK